MITKNVPLKYFDLGEYLSPDRFEVFKNDPLARKKAEFPEEALSSIDENIGEIASGNRPIVNIFRWEDGAIRVISGREMLTAYAFCGFEQVPCQELRWEHPDVPAYIRRFYRELGAGPGA